MYGPPSGIPDPNLPQPPDQSQQQPPPDPMSLGQANQQMAPQGNPYLEQYLQTHQFLAQQAQGMKTPLSPDPPSPSLLESLATFGIANLKHHADVATTREQNYIQHQKNLAVDAHVNDMAIRATDAQATAAGLAGRANLAQQNFNLRMLENIQKLTEQGYQHDRDKIRDQMPMPTTPEGRDMADAAGLEQDPQHPRYMRPRLQPKAGGGWEAPAPGSPMAGALGGGGAGAADSGPLPNESPQDYARRKKTAAAGAEKTSTEDAAAAAETMRNMKLVESWLKDPMFDRAVSDLPNQGVAGIAESAAGPAVAYLKRRTGSPGAAYLGTANTNVMPALRAMEAGAKNMRIAGQVLGDFGVKKQMTQLQNYRMSQPEAQQFKQTLLDRFKQIRQQLGTGSDSTASTTPPSTGAPTQPTGATGVTPGGVRFRVIQ